MSAPTTRDITMTREEALRLLDETAEVFGGVITSLRNRLQGLSPGATVRLGDRLPPLPAPGPLIQVVCHDLVEDPVEAWTPSMGLGPLDDLLVIITRVVESLARGIWAEPTV